MPSLCQVPLYCSTDVRFVKSSGGIYMGDVQAGVSFWNIVGLCPGGTRNACGGGFHARKIGVHE